MWNFTLTLDDPVSIAGFTLGLLAAVLLTAYNVPTAIKMHRRRDGTIVSVKSIAMQGGLQITTLAYGILEQQVPLIVSNVAGLAVLLVIIILRKKYWIDKPAIPQLSVKDPPQKPDPPQTSTSLDLTHMPGEVAATDHPGSGAGPEACAEATGAAP